jgi:7-cyano-7-deazaguanine synthase
MSFIVDESYKTSETIVCIVSGGLDSICTSAHLRKKDVNLYMITYSYGQRSMQEIECAKKFSNYLNFKEHKIVDISFLKEIYGKTNVLTDKQQDIPENFDYKIVVPIRNAIFITIATAWAMSIGAKMVVYGAHIDDHNYPDCRPEFVSSINKALNLGESDGIALGLRNKVYIWSPAIDGIDKSELIRIGYQNLGDKLFETWSCYSNGVCLDKKMIHCGICESCINRRIAFRNANIRDKTKYAHKR